MKAVVTGFVNTMPKPQRTAGLIYLPFHVLIIPVFIGMLADYLPGGLDDVVSNIIYYSIGLVFCLAVMWRYLRNAYDILIDNFTKNIIAFIFAYIICVLLSYLAAGIIFVIFKDSAENPNNSALLDMAGGNPGAVMGLTIFAAPVVEEILFRGVLFGSIQPRHRILAFILSIALFSFYHIWQYALVSMDWTVLFYMVQYIPAGYALAWLYEKTNCIWMPIFLHMSINFISMAAMR